MSVVGIDFGNVNSVVAVARNRGIDIICNEVSNRATPSLVSFGEKSRFIGESARTQQISNFKNTVSSLKRLLGRDLNDPEIQYETQYVNCQLVEHETGVAVNVNYQNEAQTFTACQLNGMYLGKLKQLAAKELGSAVTDVVVAVPGYYNDRQRRAMMDAVSIAGMNCLRLINDTTAVALAYGITKTDLPEDQPRHVCFVDIGHSSYSVSIVAYTKGKLQVKATSYDIRFGGRDFDEVLVDHFHEQFLQKYKIDIKSNPKALFRLRAAAERTKKVLSANSQSNINVESIMDDKDVSGMITRAEFEQLASGLFARVEATVQSALQKANLSVADIDSIETVGGSTRIPVIKEKLSAFFGKPLSVTLNQDEAVARGCAFMCAILSPTFKVREFSVSDVNCYPIKMTYAPSEEDPEDKEVVVFDALNSVPSTKLINFDRSAPFQIETMYADDSVGEQTKKWIATHTIKNVVPQTDGSPSKVKVKVRLNGNGTFSIEGAQIVEEHVEEQAEGEPKTVVKRTDLSVVGSTNSLAPEVLSQLYEAEQSMLSSDKLVFDTSEMKNSLEEYIYDIRNKLEGVFSEFLEEKAKEKFLGTLRECENWLYDEGDDVTKSAYQERLESLKKIGEPVVKRAIAAEKRPVAEASLRNLISQFVNQAQSTDEKLEHISQEDRRKVLEKCESTLKWLDSKIATQQTLPKHQDPVISVAEIDQERENLVFFATPILTQPKPKKEEPKEEAGGEAGGDVSMEETEQAETNEDAEMD